MAEGNGHDIAYAADGDHSADALFAAAFAEEAPPSEHSSESRTEACPSRCWRLRMARASRRRHAGENGDNWGGNWGGFGEEAAHGETAHAAVADDTMNVAAHEEGEDAGMAHIDFASITGKSPPGAPRLEMPADEGPARKRPQARTKNPIVFVLGLVLSGLLAFGCVLGFAAWRGIKLDFLPSWMQFNRPSSQTANKPNNQPAPNRALGADGQHKRAVGEFEHSAR